MRLAPGLITVLLTASGALSAADPVVGHWFWVEHQTLAFHADHTVQLLKGPAPLRVGSWAAAGEGNYQVRLPKDAAPQEYLLSADGFTLTTRTPEGVQMRGEQIDNLDK